MDYISRIKKIKSEKKITNEKLSELTGIPLGTLSKILAGISDSPKLSNMVLIAEALGCTLDHIVTGAPDISDVSNLSDVEMRLLENYRHLDAIGKEVVSLVAEKEAERAGIILESRGVVSTTNTSRSTRREAKILPPISTVSERRREFVGSDNFKRKDVLLYDLPVSAGPGVYLDDSIADVISIPYNEKTQATSYALRIRGDSMEPKYHDGDILLVEDTESVEVGELGIFMLDGNGYFKKFGGDRLISLNSDYGDILLSNYLESVCCGRVLGKLRKK